MVRLRTDRNGDTGAASEAALVGGGSWRRSSCPLPALYGSAREAGERLQSLWQAEGWRKAGPGGGAGQPTEEDR